MSKELFTVFTPDPDFKGQVREVRFYPKCRVVISWNFYFEQPRIKPRGRLKNYREFDSFRAFQYRMGRRAA